MLLPPRRSRPLGPERLQIALACAACALMAACLDDGGLYVPCGGNNPRDARADFCVGAADGCYDIALTRDDGTEGRGRLCSAACDDDDACPMGRCLVLTGDPEARPLCFQECASTAECFAGFRCTRIADEGAAGASPYSVCLP